MKFKLTDYVHYERNDPAEQQSIYFDVSPEFGERLDSLLQRVDQEFAKRGGPVDMREALVYTAELIEAEFGLLTIEELLLVTHIISSHINFQRGRQYGYMDGRQSILRELAEQANSFQAAPPNKKWGGSSGIA